MGPEAVLIASAVAATASTVVSTVQNVQAANAAADAEEANAEISRQNAQVARDKAVAREIAVRRENRRILAQRSAAMAETGIATTGSAAAGFGQNAMLGEFDAILTRFGGDMESRGFNIDAMQASDRARNVRRTIPGTVISGALGAGAQALSGYGNYQLNRRLPGSTPLGSGASQFGKRSVQFGR